MLLTSWYRNRTHWLWQQMLLSAKSDMRSHSKVLHCDKINQNYMATPLQLVIILLRKQSYWTFYMRKLNIGQKGFSDDAQIPKLYFDKGLLSILLFLLLYSCSSILFLSFHGFWQINFLRGKGINFRTVMEDTTSYLGKAESINSRNRKLLGR